MLGINCSLSGVKVDGILIPPAICTSTINESNSLSTSATATLKV